VDEQERKERKRQRSKEWQQKLRADPERYAEFLQRKRTIYYKRGLARSREWKKNNPEKIKAYKRADYLKHRDKYRARDKERYQKKRSERLAKEKARRAMRRDEILAIERARRAANPEKYRAQNRAFKKANPNSVRLYSVKKAARVHGVAFDLDLEWFETRISAGVCEMSGIPFDFSKPHHLGGRTPNTPSVDRKNPKGPYTKENCRLIVWWLNRAMMDLGEDYALKVFRGIFIKRGEITEYEDRMAA
jgi:hypothetical protein